MKIISRICKNNPCYKAGGKMTVKGLMFHSVGCNQPSALVFVNQWSQPKPITDVCAHAVIDANNGDIYQTLPWNHPGWHSGTGSLGRSKNANNNGYIGVETGEPACIKYTHGATFTCSDLATARKNAETTYKSAVELFAYLCKQYKLDPLADGVIISHSEGYKRGIASGHADPEHLWKQLGMSYTMDTFRKAVHEALNGADDNEGEKLFYRVQTGAFSIQKNAQNWLNRLKKAGYTGYIVKVGKLYKVQTGAFTVKSNAEAMMKKLTAAGFQAFIVN